MYRWLVILITVLLATPAWAVTRYVEPGITCTGNYSVANRNCSGTGSGLNSYATTTAGVTATNNGDILYLRPGTYTTRISFSGKGYTTPTTIGACIPCGDTVASVIYAPIFTAGNSALSFTSWLVVQDLTISGVNGPTLPDDNSIKGIYIDTPDNWIIQRTNISGFHYSGIQAGQADNIIIRNNIIHDQISTTCISGTRWYGIYYSGGNNGLIEKNEIYNNPGGGMQVYPDPINAVVRANNIHDNNHCASSLIGGILTGGATGNNTQVYNNLIYRNGLTEGVSQAPCVTVYPPSTNIRVWNNTCYNNQMRMIVLNGSVNAVITNNIDTGYVSAGSTGGTNTTRSFNACTAAETCASTNKITITGLTECTVSTTDFHLRSSPPTNPCVNTGPAIPMVTTDYDGVARPPGGPYDIGAYEFIGAADITPPAAPTGLTLH